MYSVCNSTCARLFRTDITLQCLEASTLLGEFFEGITGQFVDFVNHQRSGSEPSKPECHVPPAPEQRTHAQQMARLGGLSLEGLMAEVDPADLDFVRSFVVLILKMKSVWLDSTHLRSHSEVRDRLRDRTNQERSRLCSLSLPVRVHFSMLHHPVFLVNCTDFLSPVYHLDIFDGCAP